jgi:hypothetical protein
LHRFTVMVVDRVWSKVGKGGKIDASVVSEIAVQLAKNKVASGKWTATDATWGVVVAMLSEGWAVASREAVARRGKRWWEQTAIQAAAALQLYEVRMVMGAKNRGEYWMRTLHIFVENPLRSALWHQRTLTGTSHLHNDTSWCKYTHRYSESGATMPHPVQKHERVMTTMA